MTGPGTPAPALAVRGLEVRRGSGAVLRGVDLAVDRGETVALFGRNGAGKTTLVEAVMGLVGTAAGSVTVEGTEVTGRAPHDIAGRGVALVPQGRRVFAPLTVEENLAVAARTAPSGPWDPRAVLDLLPRLGQRRSHRGDQLSGGEQQMLAVARALVRNPRLILLDEPSEGLAPRVVEQIGRVLEVLGDDGAAVLLVEQNLGLGVRLADRVVILDRGRIAYRGGVSAFRRDGATARRLLGVG